MVVTFITGNLKDCLAKELILFRNLIIVLFHTWIIMVKFIKQNLMESV